MAAESNLEQHFILRVQNAELAAKLRGWLRDQATVDNITLVFDQCANPRWGALTVDGVQHGVVLQDMPTVVESYKTLDDANLVKVADIGQVLLVVDPDVSDQQLPFESRDGVTPPMRKVRARHFRPPINLPHALVEDAAQDVIDMLSGRAPDGYTFHDVEEEYVVDAMTGEGRWQQVKPGKQRAAAAAAADAGGAGSGRQQRAAKRKPKAAGSEDEEEDFEGMTDSD
ncbi:TAFII55 protein conserved region-domain-containing protein [Scenedesmus sp. NREL 46B-D3]|nr:TAFII55 protein conserved region-domain-containing protein [Scenedesmus sp. NREL 46B-D3]